MRAPPTGPSEIGDLVMFPARFRELIDRMFVHLSGGFVTAFVQPTVRQSIPELSSFFDRQPVRRNVLD